MKKLLTVVLFILGMNVFALDMKNNGDSFIIFPGREWTTNETYIRVEGKNLLIRQGIYGQGIYIYYDDINDLGRNVAKAIKVLQFWENFNGGEFTEVHPEWFLDVADNFEIFYDKGNAHLKNVEIVE